MITGGDLRQSRLDVGYKTFTISPCRARRKEYWMFTLFSTIAVILFAFIDHVVLGAEIGILGLIYSLAVFIPSFAVLFRRLHDTNRSAWWILIALIPLVGAIVLLVFLCFDSEPGQNRFGVNPKYSTAS